MACSFLCPGAPNDQPVGDFHTARSAIFVGVLNAIASTSYLQLCLSGGGGGTARDVDRSYCLYQFASYLTAMLGVALLAVDMGFPATVTGSPVWEPVFKWAVWITRS
ncbi:hypothetical protein BAE44_0006850 [Dichanthelium oligosanthes]|uniref:Uncharacterized protein n=1 Tax=Dichanthelium oligosanthes TaxID=888268 RepID=A0A1E5W435_9POAL|nr:hypothetical protein BAE44_0006850 [Dichanthelium oligosanthes]